jgi:hypothetical protein
MVAVFLWNADSEGTAGREVNPATAKFMLRRRPQGGLRVLLR